MTSLVKHYFIAPNFEVGATDFCGENNTISHRYARESFLDRQVSQALLTP
jgi:hypothetical protein